MSSDQSESAERKTMPQQQRFQLFKKLVKQSDNDDQEKDIKHLCEQINDLRVQLQQKDYLIEQLRTDVDELKEQIVMIITQQYNQSYKEEQYEQEQKETDDSNQGYDPDFSKWKNQRNNVRIQLKLKKPELNESEIKETLLIELQQKRNKIKTASSYIFDSLIDVIKNLEPQDVFPEMKINSYDYIKKLVHNIRFDWFDSQLITNMAQLKHTAVVAKYIPSWGMRLDMDEEKLKSIPDEIWRYMFDAMSEEKYYSLAFFKRRDYAVIRRIEDGHIFVLDQFTKEYIDQYRSQLEDWLCDAFISVSNQGVKKPFFKIRHLAYTHNGSTEIEITLKYPKELKSCYLHHSVITNLSQCTNLKTMTCFKSHKQQELKEKKINCQYYEFKQ